jgi:hypothetical protein
MTDNIFARMWRLYKTGIGLTTGFIRSHTVTDNYSLLTVSSLVACLPIPQDPFAGNSATLL